MKDCSTLLLTMIQPFLAYNSFPNCTFESHSYDDYLMLYFDHTFRNLMKINVSFIFSGL